VKLQKTEEKEGGRRKETKEARSVSAAWIKCAKSNRLKGKERKEKENQWMEKGKRPGARGKKANRLQTLQRHPCENKPNRGRGRLRVKKLPKGGGREKKEAENVFWT